MAAARRALATHGGKRGRGAEQAAEEERAHPSASLLAVHDTIVRMLVCALGDLLLDVIVQLERPLEAGDDVRAATRLGPGGQAANVAAWAAALGAQARLVCRWGDDENGRLLAAELAERGVEVLGEAGGRSGVVVSLVGPDGERSMASDRAADLARIDPAWIDGADALHISGYALTDEAVAAARPARRVSLDLSATTLLDEAFRKRAVELGPEVVFATEAEREALGLELEATWVVKRGGGGIVVDGEPYAALPAQVVDTTGAGDALAAGFLIGGPELALEAAARCVAKLGAMP